MSSEQLADGVNPLDAELAATWDILKGYSGRDTDLGIARRFGGAAAAYSLRDIGAMNGRVVKARRDVGETSDPEEDFSANQVSSGALEDWVNGKLEDTLPADSSQGLTVVVQHSLINSGTETTIKFYADSLTSGSPRFFSNDKTYKFYKGLSDNRYILQLTDSTNLIKASASDADKLPQDVTTYESVTGTLTSITVTSSSPAAAAYSLRKVDSSYSGNAVRIRRSSDDVEVDVAFDSDDKVSASSAITNIAEQGGEIGSTTATDLNGFLNETLTVGTAVNGTGSFPYDQFTANGNTGFDADNKGGGTSSAGFPYAFSTGDVFVIRFTVSNFDSESGLSPGFRGTTGTNSVTGATTGGSTFTANGTYTETHTATADGTHMMCADGNTGSYTISDFEIVSHTHQAFVHTWYDQAGSNNAVQETAGNQPKIAENGALLADGLDFDGSNDEMVLTSALGATTVQSIFAVQKNDITSGGSLLFDNRDANDDGSALFATDSAGNKQASWDAADAEHTATTNEELIGLIKTSSAITIRANGVQKSSTSSSSTIDISTVPKIGQGSFGSSGTNYDGSIKEIICYNSDQSANSFKIESNINNYYSLYNDANDLTQTEWQNTGAESFSSTSTDGFSYSNSSSTAFIGITLSETLALNDSVFVSFNASGITHPDSSDQSPQIRLRDSVSGGNGSSIINQVVNGFNSYTLTYNDATKANGQNIVFSEGDTGGGTVTISDFKVSRIPRNGFVETLYDQSGNGRDISQASASNQPTIVSNGGIYKSGAYPSIRYTDTSATYLVTESYSPVEQGGSGMPNFTLFAVTGIPESAGFDSIVSAGGSEGSNSIGGFKLRHLKDASGNIDSRIDIAQTGVSPHQANAQSNNATPQSVNLLTSYLDSTDDELFAQQNSATSGTTTTTLIPLSGQGAENDNLKVGTDMFNDSPRASYLGEILEIILYTDSKKSDLSDLTDEINNFYNI